MGFHCCPPGSALTSFAHVNSSAIFDFITRDKIASDFQPDALQHLIFIKQAGKLHPPEVLPTWKGDLFQIK